MNQKNLFQTVLTVCLLAMSWMTMSAQDNVLRGDVNGDENVTIADVTSLINYLLSEDASAVNLPACDVNRDTNITIGDVTELINYLLTDEWPYEVEPEMFTVSSVTFKMIPVQGGTFMMGAREDDPYVRPWESPAHEVTLSDYYICEVEVTQALWRAVMGTSNNPSWFCSTNGYTNNFNRPVECVTYSQALNFITKLNQKLGKTFRLPTEAEWEYAARGGKKTHGYLYAGSNDIEEVAWHRANAGEITHAVAEKAPNELGLYDMSGNVEEWCSDYYGLYSSEAQVNPTGPTSGTYRVTRGGCWDQAFRACRVTYRYDAIPTSGTTHYGLRLAMSF